jgi:hypothetical protein
LGEIIVSLGLGLLKGGMLLNLFLSRRHLIQDKYRQQEAPDSCKKETPQGREKNWNARTYYEDLYTKNVVGGSWTLRARGEVSWNRLIWH